MYKNDARLSTLYQDAFHDTQAICSQRLSKHGIHFFDYARMFDDGSCYIVSNHEDVINYLFKTAAPMFAPVPLATIKEKFYYFIPEQGAYQKVIHDARTCFNLANIIDLFEVHDGYVDICCFGGAADNDGMLNYYLNHLDELNNFCAHFKERAQDMLNKLNANRIQLPKEMQLNFDSKTVIKKSGNLFYQSDKMNVYPYCAMERQ